MRYFRPHAPSVANERKSESFDNEAAAREALRLAGRKTHFSPPCGTFWCEFSPRNTPWSATGIPWSGKSMGACRRNTPWKRPPLAVSAPGHAWKADGHGVRFNALPNGAQPDGAPGGRLRLRPQRPAGGGLHRRFVAISAERVWLFTAPQRTGRRTFALKKSVWQKTCQELIFSFRRDGCVLCSSVMRFRVWWPCFSLPCNQWPTGLSWAGS